MNGGHHGLDYYYYRNFFTGIGVVATLFEERYMAVKRLGRLIMEILEDREISQEQQEKIVYKIRKILGRD